MNSIESNPEILNGILLFKGTRVPVRNLFDYLLAGESVKDFLEDFPTVSFEQNRFSDLAHLKNEIISAVKSVSKGDINHVS